MASVSVLLGFLSKNKPAEIVIATALSLCVPIMFVILFRILNKRNQKERTERYYTNTVMLFVVGISIPFAAILVVMLEGC